MSPTVSPTALAPDDVVETHEQGAANDRTAARARAAARVPGRSRPRRTRRHGRRPRRLARGGAGSCGATAGLRGPVLDVGENAAKVGAPPPVSAETVDRAADPSLRTSAERAEERHLDIAPTLARDGTQREGAARLDDV